ncbi:MBL fold metallo-hydrolase [Streptomyces sedi]|uniref:MBL fold metallo-hydrolase n=1 Tax=Streptomyces sedi TaxID=555059 RepID=A0A5C4V603_9ACTN|nr:MBL fold metallo-hydrolase [Streptomyces sedi]TNM31223.1 MBL fold metallo-hydrolase [Streptomyces sedi]
MTDTTATGTTATDTTASATDATTTDPTATELASRIRRFVLGDVEIIRLVEWHRPFAPAAELVPEAAPEAWTDHAESLVPDHYEPVNKWAVLALQYWVLRSEGRTILVDTGAGNGRERPGMPPFHQCEGDFLDLLAAAGLAPDDVDLVVNTHLHVDHVGWNTRAADDGTWVPTFPHARYLLPAADDHHYGPENAYGGGAAEVDRLIYQDSVAPIHRAGLAQRWDGHHRLDGALTLESAPGHTPGSSVLRLASGTDRAVFAGDLLHSPVQIPHPHHNSGACLAPAQAAATRHRVLQRAADEGELLIPAHFGGSGVVEVRRDGGAFTATDWQTGHSES